MCLLVAFFSFLRRSNLTPDSLVSFDKSRHLCREDVSVRDDELLVSIKWSKTLQKHDRDLVLPVMAIPGHALCSRAAFLAMCQGFPTAPSAPLFCLSGPADSPVPLTSSVLSSFLMEKLSQLGFDSALYSIHSFRRGGATFAFDCGVDPLLIKLQGDWRSDAYLEYISLPLQSCRCLGVTLAQAVRAKV